MAVLFKPFKITSDQLNSLSIVEGRFIICTDTGEMYLDKDSTHRIQLSGATGDEVTGVKGDSESDYRTGNVNITKSNIGLSNVENKSSATIRGELTSSDVTTALGYTPPQQDTTYTFSDGVSASGTTVTNSGVRSVSTGSTNGTISVNTNGTAAEVSVAGLGNLAYENSLSASDVGAIATSLKGANNGVAELDNTGKVPSSQLPSYVDDVLEYASQSNFPATGETGKIYVAMDTNKTYRWSGSAYVEISESLALGTTSSTAYRGDYGSTAYSHATDSSKLTTATASGLYKVASTSEGHIAGLTAVTKSDITALGIPAQDTTYNEATTSANGLMSSSDKTKLNGISTGAQVNVIETIKVNGTALTVTDKAVDITIPNYIDGNEVSY